MNIVSKKKKKITMNKVIKWSHNLMITQLILYFTNKN